MSCCGGKRMALKNQIAPQGSSTRVVRYTGGSPVTIRGPITGRDYHFSPQQPVQNIDSRDAALLSHIPKIHE